MLKKPFPVWVGFFSCGTIFYFFFYRKRMGDGSLIILASEML